MVFLCAVRYVKIGTTIKKNSPLGGTPKLYNRDGEEKP